MPRPLDLESLKAVFADNRTHIALAKVTRLSLLTDRSGLQVMVSIFPNEREIVAMMSWDACGADSGVFSFPQVGDLVLVGFADGSVDYAFVLRRLTAIEEKIPVQALDGSLVMKASAGTKAWMVSDTKINLTKGSDNPTENLVLGQQLKTLLSNILTNLSDLNQKLSTHQHVSSAPGAATSAPITATDYVTLKTAFDNLKASPVQDEKILSSIAFTEKGT